MIPTPKSWQLRHFHYFSNAFSLTIPQRLRPKRAALGWVKRLQNGTSTKSHTNIRAAVQPRAQLRSVPSLRCQQNSLIPGLTSKLTALIHGWGGGGLDSASSVFSTHPVMSCRTTVYQNKTYVYYKSTPCMGFS